jgi:hypothetical protein
MSLSRFDIEALERHRMLQREEIVAEIARIDEKMVKDARRKCDVCSGRIYRHGKTRERELWTLCGLVRIRLTRLRCAGCKELTVPAKDMVADSLLSSLAEKFIALCRRNSFDQSRILLKENFGIDIPTMTLHAYVRRQSEYFDNDIVKATEELYDLGLYPEVEVTPDTSKPLYLAIDEGLVRDWGYIHARDKDATRFTTVYCAVFFDGRELITKSDDAKKRYQLTNRFGHATCRADVDSYFRELVMLSYQRGYTSSRTLFILTDGARYLTSRIKEFFPEAIPLLDLYHLKRKIFDLIDADSPTADRVTQAMYAYSPSRLISLIDDYLVIDERSLEKKQKLLGYIERNADALRNHRGPRTKVHGSAPAEKAVDLLVARRFKGKGMSWTPKGLETLLRFQVLDYNNELESYWNARHDGQIAKNLDSLKVRSFSFAQNIEPKLKGDHYYHQVHLNDTERTKGVIVY